MKACQVTILQIIISAVLGLSSTIVVERNHNAVLSFGFVHNHDLNMQNVESGCNFSHADKDISTATTVYASEFTPEEAELGTIQKCFAKSSGYYSSGKGFCVSGLKAVLKRLRKSTLNYIIIKDGYQINSLLATNKSNSRKVLIHYAVPEDDEELFAMNIERHQCLPFIKYLHYAYQNLAPAIYKFTQADHAIGSSDFKTGIVGRGGLGHLINLDERAIDVKSTSGASNTKVSTLVAAGVIIYTLVA